MEVFAMFFEYKDGLALSGSLGATRSSGMAEFGLFIRKLEITIMICVG